MRLELRGGAAGVAAAHAVGRAGGKAEVVERGLLFDDLLARDRVDRRAVHPLRRGAPAFARLGAFVDDDAADRAADDAANKAVGKIRRRTCPRHGRDRCRQHAHGDSF
ncbi:MAG: hypothetical protein M5U35_08340 [Roseovarius sp.]|nr:hypothetical protein [Roseovarius sp.]